MIILASKIEQSQLLNCNQKLHLNFISLLIAKDIRHIAVWNCDGSNFLQNGE